MKTRISHSSLACVALVLWAGTLPVSANVPTAMGEAGDYEVRIEVKPPGPYTGPKAELLRDGGDQPLERIGSLSPNHRLVVTVLENNRPVEQATVVILYRNFQPPHVGPWLRLPVVRTHVAGKGPESTQFGNNVRIGPGLCQVSVSVNGEGALNARFLLRP
jgi:hypothetical protein